MRVLIVDDEAPARRKLHRLLAESRDVEIVGEAHSGTSAVDAIRAHRPDVVFLDIQMPEGDGFDVIAAVGTAEMPWTVFLTAFDEHAVRAFEVEALDYVLKPYSPERLAATLERVRARLAAAPAPQSGGNESGALDRVLQHVAPTAGPLRHVLVEHGERSVFLPVERIDWAESDRNYVALHAAGHSFTVRSTLQTLEARLDPARFLRINRSQLIRLEAVREVHPWSHGDQHVVMLDGTRLVWSRRFRARDDGRFGL
jgi:two-component system LytT family response regulator